MFKSKPLPTFTMKIGPIADSKTKEDSCRIPNNILAPLICTEILHLFLEILADVSD